MRLGQVVTFTSLGGDLLQGTVWSQGPADVRASWWLTRAPARYVLVQWSPTKSNPGWLEVSYAGSNSGK